MVFKTAGNLASNYGNYRSSFEMPSWNSFLLYSYSNFENELTGIYRI